MPKQIEIPDLLYMCAPCSKLPTNKNTKVYIAPAAYQGHKAATKARCRGNLATNHLC